MFKLKGYTLVVLTSAAMILAGCSSEKGRSNRDPFAGKGSPYYAGKGPLPRGGGRYLVGDPYQVAGRWFVPRVQPGYDKKGLASWYGEAFHRRQTSNGEYFDMAMLSAAHATLPLPSYAKVTNLENGRSVVVRINDRGPFVDTRVIDLSKRSADVLGFKRQGTVMVRVQYIGPAPLNDQGPHLAMMNERMQEGANVRSLVAAASGKKRTQIAEVDTIDEEAGYQTASAPVERVARKERAGFVVAVAFFANSDNAAAAGDGLSHLGPVRVFQLEGEDGLQFALQLGPFRSEYAARQALDEARESGFPDASVAAVKIQAVAGKP
jgi:rare lipoprotein A